jgi:hypothetical protein
MHQTNGNFDKMELLDHVHTFYYTSCESISWLFISKNILKIVLFVATCLSCKRMLLSLQELIIMGTYKIMSFEINCCPQLHSPSEFQVILKLKHTCLSTSPTLGGRGFTSNGSLRLFKCNVNVYFFTLYFFFVLKVFHCHNAWPCHLFLHGL